MSKVFNEEEIMDQFRASHDDIEMCVKGLLLRFKPQVN